MRVTPLRWQYQSKVRVVLNKADNVESQKLMRVYGALMWSLGGIVCSPEVPRVYIGSFIDEPWVHEGLVSLMDAEENDLVRSPARSERDRDLPPVAISCDLPPAAPVAAPRCPVEAPPATNAPACSPRRRR